MYDYGTSANQKIYRSNRPPSYNLSQITAPVTVIYGSKDAIVSPDGVLQLIRELPNVRQTYELPWNHLDVILARDVDVLVNDKIIRDMIAEANEGL